MLPMVVRSHSIASFASSLAISACALVLLAPAGCESKEPQSSSYFQRTIAPILATSCVRTNTGAGCHVADEKGNAFGNLDVSSYDGVAHRRDLLLDYGPYGQPSFLVKNVAPYAVQVQAYDGQKATVTTDIKHAGGSILDPTASAYQTIRRWIANGATENNGGAPPQNLVRLGCSKDIPTGIAGFDAGKDPTTPDFATFRDRVNTTIGSTCSASNCHGSTSNDLYLTCGETPEQLRWNYFAASEYLAPQAEQSEIVRRPLAATQGGAFHEGGAIFTSTGDAGYQGLLQWAKDHGPPNLGAVDPGLEFFAHKVQPLLVKKGCMMVQCHSAAMFHDYRLRGGSGGSFSLSATKRNYGLTLAQMALESDDVNASRLVRKNLYRPEVHDGSTGLTHRGGPLLEDFVTELATGGLCDKSDKKTPAYDYDKGDLDKIPAYCVIREWHKRERASRSLAPLSAVVYVKRSIAPAPNRAQDFDAYAPGADLHVAKATLTPAGDVTIGADASVTTGCGLDKATADIRKPAVSWDGKRVAFAARASAGEPLQIYEMNADGSGCAKNADLNGPPAIAGLAVHNFDPAYVPTYDNPPHIVFASTRGNLAKGAYDYDGPQRTPADPSKLNSNLYAWEGAGKVRQLTFHLNMERHPSFMSDGRVIFTLEKRAPGFYQLALRRINLDGGDYHPLYAQRGSIGYDQAQQVVELADKNFAAIFSDKSVPHGGGALGVFNRSIGIDFTSADPKDYVVDPAVIDPASPSSPEGNFFLHSLHFPDGGAKGVGQTTGLYTSPSALPGTKLLVSFGAATDAASFGGDYDVYVIEPVSGAKTKVLGDAGTAEIDAVAVYARATRDVFRSRLDEPNGTVKLNDGRAEADITVLDVPVLASLLFQNTPTGRTLETDLDKLDVYEDLPPPLTMTSFASGDPNVASDGFGFGPVFVKRRLLGTTPVSSDGSTRFQIPGGVPVVFHLPDTKISRDKKLPRWQRESVTFAPGEYANQSFKREFFSGLCGQCHGSVSGRPLDIAVQPDILTQASNTASRGNVPLNLNKAPSDRGQPIGPPAAP